MFGQEDEHYKNEEAVVKSKERAEEPHNFLNAIERDDLKEILKPEKPWAYWTMEIYRDDIKGAGGLGVLASDTLEVAKKAEIPSVFVTPFYSKESVQILNKNFEQEAYSYDITPEERGFEFVGNTEIRTLVDGKIIPSEIKIHKKQEGSVALASVYEKNFGGLYEKVSDSDHRLYQEVVLGIGGNKALETLGVKPPIHQLNEAPTVFSALSRLDQEAENSGNFKKALEKVREGTLYTNHTLVQAAEAKFTAEQFERFVIPNLKNQELKSWLSKKFEENGGKIALSSLAIELSGEKNCVSMIHAQGACKTYRDLEGNLVDFEAVTNGIAMEKWGDPEFLKYLRESRVIDKFDLPAADYKIKISNLSDKKLQKIKEAGRLQLRNTLRERKNQYGKPVRIPIDARVFDWARRLADYKRPGMIFERSDELSEILKDNNAYLVMAGKAHPTDLKMKLELKRILKIIDEHPVLKERVHFIENYDEAMGRALAQGSDVALNTPTVRDERGERISTEACGTSGWKKILGLTIVESTADGGFADLEMRAKGSGRKYNPSFLEIKGKNYQEEVDSMYDQMRLAAEILDDPQKKAKQLKKQLSEFLPIISGARMEKDYLNMVFPKKAEQGAKEKELAAVG